MRLQHFSELSVKNNRVNNRFATVCILYGPKVRFEESISMDEVHYGRMVTFLINNSDEG